MLFLIGLGLDTKDISAKAIDALKSSSAALLLDQYTNFIPDAYVSYLEDISGKKIAKLERKDLEEDAAKTVAPAKKSNICLLVSGDPLMATTHQILIEECEKQGIEYSIFHSSSIMTAAMGESGLIPYRFGKTTTIPFWTDSYKPTSFIDIINSNLKYDAHTLVLLDYNYSKREGLPLGAALGQLKIADLEKERGIISQDTKLIILGNIGRDKQKIVYASIKNLQEKKTQKIFDQKIITIIFPAKLTTIEQEFVSRFEL